MTSTSGDRTQLGDDEELRALDCIAETIEDNARDQRLLARRVRQLRAGRAKGRSWRHLLDGDRPPTVISLLGRIHRRTADFSVTLRRRLARGLRAEGSTIPAIGETFGVSHQRVSTLLRDGTAPGEDSGQPQR